MAKPGFDAKPEYMTKKGFIDQGWPTTRPRQGEGGNDKGECLRGYLNNEIQVQPKLKDKEIF